MILFGFILRLYHDAGSSDCQFICNSSLTCLPPLESLTFLAKYKCHTNCPIFRVPEHGVCNFAECFCGKLFVFGDTVKGIFCVYWKVKQFLYNPGPALNISTVWVSKISRRSADIKVRFMNRTPLPQRIFLVHCFCNVTAHAQKPDFVFRAKRISPFKSARWGASVQSTAGSRAVRHQR